MNDDLSLDTTRRGFLGLAAGGLALSAAIPPAAARTVQTSARIVILGAGAGGASIANRLMRRLDGATITIVDGSDQHWYQPGFTLIASGLKSARYAISGTGDWLPDGIEWVREDAAAIDPEANRVVTEGGERIDYDYLIVATGLTLDWGAVEGFDLDMVGRNGIGAVYAGPDYAEATWRAMDAFTDAGGRGVFFRPPTEMKCAGAPIKYTFLTDDYLRRKGTRTDSQVTYVNHSQALFGVPVITEKVELLMRDKDVEVHRHHRIKGVDAERRELHFETDDGDARFEYDFTNIIPPQRAPEAVRQSGLSWEDRWQDQGWIEVDMHTLRHRRFPNVFGIGDINGVPKGKTAASVKFHVPVVEDHLVAELEGREGSASFDGYTSCPLITRVGRAMLVEFDYEDNLVPSFPGVIAPLEELWISWLMKEIALKPTYNAMLRGRA